MVYMPCVASLLTSATKTEHIEHDTTSTEWVENASLWLPSALPASLSDELRTTGLSPGLLEKERRLRVAQADDALAEVRRQH
jgi:hypothetical protein